MTYDFVLQILNLRRSKLLLLGVFKVGEKTGIRAIRKPSYKNIWHFLKCKKSEATIVVYTLCSQECKKSDEMQKVQLRSANDCQRACKSKASVAVYTLYFQDIDRVRI